MNTFYRWGSAFKMTSVSTMFSVLKEISELYLADPTKELKSFVDQNFQGVLRSEDVLELLASRTDYDLFKEHVESTGGESCVIQ
jgi:hypothetical protein